MSWRTTLLFGRVLPFLDPLRARRTPWPRRLRWRSALGIAFCLTAAGAGAACRMMPSARGGDEERQRRTVLATEYDDVRAGQEAAEEVAAELGMVEDPALTAYVTEVGERLAEHAPDRTFSYSFEIVDQAEPNAFALPGGHIYVSRGAIALANNEDELANVIAHEITHAAERHAAARQMLAMRQSPLVMPLLSIARLAAYSRDQERSADRGGQRMAAASGYDPAGMARFLDQMRDFSRLDFSYSQFPPFYATHPGTTERVTDATIRAQGLSFERAAVTEPEASGYLKRIEGLVLGENPAEGVFEGSTFLHPDLGFRIRYPQDWKLENGRAAVGATSPDGAARIFMTLEPDAPDAELAAEAFLARNGVELQFGLERQRPVQIGPLAAYRIEGRAVIEGESVGTELTFIPFGDFMFRLTVTAPLRTAREYIHWGRVTARSFRALTPAERLSVSVLRLRAVEAKPDEDWVTLGERADNALDIRRTAVLNGLSPDVRFRGGEWVKVGVAVPYRPEPPKPPDSEGPSPANLKMDADRADR